MKFIYSLLYHLAVNLFNLLILTGEKTIYFEKELSCLKGKLEPVIEQIIQTSYQAPSLSSIMYTKTIFASRLR